MSVQGISPVSAFDKGSYTSSVNEMLKADTGKATSTKEKSDVYEKSEASDGGKWVNIADPKTVAKLKADAEERSASLRSLVEKIVMKQGGQVNLAGGMADFYRSLKVDPEVSLQAQKDISENGYWGVDQTSDRIVSFAKALAGDNLELAQKMVDAVKEGFGQAEKAWGEKLPGISQRTMSATYDKLNVWIDELTPKSEPVTQPEIVQKV